MKAKALLIPIAAFALSATGVSAFNSEVLHKAGLTDDQISAFETAHELRKDGDIDGARDVLKDAGIDLAAMEAMRQAMHAHKNEMRSAMHDAIGNNSYEEFRSAIEGSPLADIITTEEDFELFKEAHEYKEQGEHEKVKEIMNELGFKHPEKGHAFRHMMPRGL